MNVSIEEINSILVQYPGAKQIYDSFINHSWESEEDAQFVGIAISKYIIDLLTYKDLN